jgi:hypothetical protein
LGSSFVHAQQPVDLPREHQEQASASQPDPLAATASSPPETPSDGKAPTDGNASKADSPHPKIDPDESGQQTKRIMWIIPNFRSVSADTHLPPLSFKEKFWLATQDSFDYSSLIYNGLIAGAAMAEKSEPSFG